jgi:hypothetical protein
LTHPTYALLVKTVRMIYTEGKGWDWEGRPDNVARSLIPHGVDAEVWRHILERVREQGMPTLNRANRRHSQRVGDRARRAKARKQRR